MAGIFTDGMAKVRPGSYFNVNTGDKGSIAGAKDGIVAVVFTAAFGPLNEVMELERASDAYRIYGNAGRVDTIGLAFQGGASRVLAVRVGSEGTAAGTKLGEIATVTAKYPGSRDFSVSIRDSLMKENHKEVIFYSGNLALESYMVEKNGSTEGAGLKAAMEKSRNFVVKVDTDGALADVAQQRFSGGEDPTANMDSYQAGFERLESAYCNVVCVDTEDTAVHTLLNTFLDRAYDSGFFACGIVAEKPGVSLEERLAHAAVYNDEQMIYVLNAGCRQGEKICEGYQVAAIIAGMYAACSSSKTLTHKAVLGITELTDVLTNARMEDAERKGCLVLSKNPAGRVWIDNAINTLVELPENKDAGWKKMRRTKTRFELMYRMNTTADGLVGIVDNDMNGRQTVIARLNGVGAAMVQEGKLLSCKVSEHPQRQANADHAYLLVEVVDLDSLEHLYLYYTFSYDNSEEE